MSTMSMSEPFPPAPELQGELLLDVFTHLSLRQEGGTGDNERYIVLGESVLKAAITHCIFLRYPHSKRHEMEAERESLLSDANFEKWTTFYRFREKIRYNMLASEEVNSPQGARDLFHAYIGGAFTQANGPLTVNSWVYHLVLPPEDRVKLDEKMLHHSPPPLMNPPYPMTSPRPQQLQNNFYPLRGGANSFSSSLSAPLAVDDPIDGVPYNVPSPSKSVYLPRFNEITTQLRMNVQYPAEQKGPQHSPQWVVKCVVDGQELGIGAATTKQLAKEEAAKQAFHAMKFNMPVSRF